MWSTWSGCSESCGRGFKLRHRHCFDTAPCLGRKSEVQECEKRECAHVLHYNPFTDWSNWTECSATCGNGKNSLYPPPFHPFNNESTAFIQTTYDIYSCKTYAITTIIPWRHMRVVIWRNVIRSCNSGNYGSRDWGKKVKQLYSVFDSVEDFDFEYKNFEQMLCFLL